MNLGQGRSICLLKDIDAESIVVPNDTTLDLSGFNINTSSLSNSGTVILYDKGDLQFVFNKSFLGKYVLKNPVTFYAKDLGLTKEDLDLDTDEFNKLVEYTYPKNTSITVSKNKDHEDLLVKGIELDEEEKFINNYGVKVDDTLNIKGDVELAGNIYRGYEDDTALKIEGDVKLTDNLKVGFNDELTKKSNGDLKYDYTNKDKESKLIIDGNLSLNDHKFELSEFGSVAVKDKLDESVFVFDEIRYDLKEEVDEDNYYVYSLASEYEELLENIASLFGFKEGMTIEELTSLHDLALEVVEECSALNEEVKESLNINYEELLTVKHDITIALIEALVESLPTEKEISGFTDIQNEIAPVRKLVISTIPSLIRELDEQEQATYNAKYSSLLADIKTWLANRQIAIKGGPGVAAAITDSTFYNNYYLLDYLENSSNSNKTDVLLSFSEGIYYDYLNIDYKFAIPSAATSSAPGAYYYIVNSELTSGYSTGSGERWGFVYDYGNKKLWYDDYRTIDSKGTNYSVSISGVNTPHTFVVKAYNYGTNKCYTLTDETGTVLSTTPASVSSTNSQKLNGILVTPTGTWPSRFYYLKVYEKTTLKHDYVPAMRKSDSMTGIYDLVTNTFAPTHEGGKSSAYAGSNKVAIYGSKVQYTLTVTKGTGISSTNITSKTVYAGNPVSISATVSTGYHFTGWTGDFSSTTNSVSVPMDKSKSTKANAAINTYSVKYNGNGSTSGTMANSSHTYGTAKALTANSFVRAYTVTYNANGGSCSTASNTATYSFTGWNSKDDGTGTSYTDKQSVNNLTTTHNATVNMYAMWNSTSVTLPAPDTRDGYEFAGWYDAETGGNKIGEAGDSYTPTAAITLYARWIAYSYTVTLDNQEPTTAGSTSVEVVYGNEMPTITVPTKDGYTFGGYYSSEDGEGTQYYTAAGLSANNWDIASDTTLYAKWIKNTTVTFDKQGGNGGSNSVVAGYGEVMPTITTPYKTGFEFAGYYSETDGNGTLYINADGTSATNWDNENDEVTLYAHWTEIVATAKVLSSEKLNEASIFDGTYSYFDLLSSAVTNAPANSTVVMLQDCTETSTVTVNKNLTIDLNGNTVTSTVTSTYGLDLTNNASLTLTDTSNSAGRIYGPNSTSSFIHVDTNTSLTLTGNVVLENNANGGNVVSVSGSLVIGSHCSCCLAWHCSF